MAEPDAGVAAQAAILRVEARLNGVILGQRPMVRQFMTGLLAGGHILLEGLPGLGKTRMARAFCRLCGLESRRIQFTPDLMPLDITGSPFWRGADGADASAFRPGPVFANLVLADEINRASPKTQSALLEAMQERQVTVLGETHRLPEPFAVLATQNPIELEGTYPLPEAQLDRFLLKIRVPEVSLDVLRSLARGEAGGELPELSPELSGSELVAAIRAAAATEVSAAVADYAARLVMATRPGAEEGRAAYVKFGASPRAALGLAAAAKAHAFLEGRRTTGFDDVAAVALPVLRHRVILDYQARIEGIDADMVVSELIERTPALPRPAPKALAERLIGGA